ncbi:MAG TPA: ABC transporter ATP-binding protein [Kofleriaceae bacterium]|nr:ABC transporter ATP-binding protein [Kofleriaceae bacterium]
MTTVSSPGTPALRLRDVRKAYGRTTALAGVSLEVQAGEVLGLLGPNGAGKSTTMKIVAGLVRADTGEAQVGGAAAGSADARRQIGYLAELFRFPDWMRLDELLDFHQRLAGSTGGAAERDRLLHLVGLGDPAVRARRVGTFSKGMQQRAGIAQALVGDPRLVLLDEPTSALDPQGRVEVRALLHDLRRRGVAVVVNTHLLTEVERTCDRVAIMVNARVVRELALDASGGVAGASDGAPLVVRTDRGEHRRERASDDEVATLIEDLVRAGERVYDVRRAVPTLEHAYLSAIAEATTLGGTP